MSERVIIFSAPMVRALLAGTKTQTRRLVKPPARGRPDPDLRSPHGGPGDRLWVREDFRVDEATGDVVYRADRATWLRLHGPDAWAANPWVWVIGFDVVSPR